MSSFLWPLVAVVIAGILLHFIAWQWLLYRGVPLRSAALIQGISTEIVASIPFEQMLAKIIDPQRTDLLLPAIDRHIDHFLQERLQQKMPMIAMFVGEKTLATMKVALQEELHELLPQLLQQYGAQLQQKLDLAGLITFQMDQLRSEKINSMLQSALRPYLKYVLLWAAVHSLLLGLLVLVLV